MPELTDQTFRVAGGEPSASAPARADRPREVGLWSLRVRVLLTTLVLGVGVGVVVVDARRRGEPCRAPVLVLDLNTVPVEVLSALPGIGPALAREIDARRTEAPYVSLADLARRARGVGPATIARLARHLRTGAAADVVHHAASPAVGPGR